MSKSRGNVISPDEYVLKYGADSFRLYLMFGFSYIEGGPWNANGIEAVVKFLERAERIVTRATSLGNDKGDFGSAEKALDFVRNNTIKKCNDDMAQFSFNTAIARIMEYVNALYKYDADGVNNAKFFNESVNDLVLLLAPLVPHIAEELNEVLGNKYSVFNRPYPKCNESALVKDEYELAVQVNSRMKGKIVAQRQASDEEIKMIALASPAVIEAISGKEIVKTVVIPNRLINIVVK